MALSLTATGEAPLTDGLITPVMVTFTVSPLTNGVVSTRLADDGPVDGLFGVALVTVSVDLAPDEFVTDTVYCPADPGKVTDPSVLVLGVKVNTNGLPELPRPVPKFDAPLAGTSMGPTP